MSVMPQDVLTDHEYDGIREYDNPTPGWWWAIFWVTVFFSAAYWLVYHIGTVGPSIHSDHEKAVGANLRVQFAEIGELKPDEATLVKYMHDAKWLTVGKLVFKARCVLCHGGEGEGGVGPNMTDDHYKNIRKLTDIPTVVMNGAAAGAMPGWKTQLHANEIVLVSAYVATLRGQNLPGPRPAEGDAIAAWPPPSDEIEK